MTKETTTLLEAHRQLAKEVLGCLNRQLDDPAQRCSLAIGGASGTQKTELATAIEHLWSPTLVVHLDDFSIGPRDLINAMAMQMSWKHLPRLIFTDMARSILKAWHIGEALAWGRQIDRDTGESDIVRLPFGNRTLLLAEGTWAGLLADDVTYYIHLAATHEETRGFRERRGRDPMSPELEGILVAEQRCLDKLASSADLVIHGIPETGFRVEQRSEKASEAGFRPG